MQCNALCSHDIWVLKILWASFTTPMIAKAGLIQSLCYRNCRSIFKAMANILVYTLNILNSIHILINICDAVTSNGRFQKVLIHKKHRPKYSSTCFLTHKRCQLSLQAGPLGMMKVSFRSTPTVGLSVLTSVCRGPSKTTWLAWGTSMWAGILLLMQCILL